MRKIFPWIAVLIFLLGCDKNTVWKDQLAQMKVKGDVDWLDERYFVIFDGKAIPMSGSVQYFNEQGWVINEVTYKKGNEFESRNVMEMDGTGKPVSGKRMDEDGNVTHRLKFSYNEKTRQTVLDAFMPEGEHLAYRITRQFDHNWNNVEESLSGAEGNLVMTTQKTLDEDGNIVKVRQTDADETQEIIQEFTYDNNGVALSGFNPGDATGASASSFKYQWDDQGNWIRKDIFKGGVLTEYTLRTYKYR
ncbi:MAG: hypothetical protein H6581_19405 [Bacteroidia bacterium]|nr:hypothetical protein [Bacteroidia bacterium]